MQEILRIGGQEVDFIPNTIQRTIQINDLGSADSRESSYSQTIKLPRTSRNQKVFNFLGVSGNTSRVPYQNLSADYIVNGIPLVINGFTEVKATKEYYEIVIYDGVIDLAEKLKNRTLSTLNYSDLNHYLNPQTFINSFENTEGYIYALGSFGIGNFPNRIERQVPSVYVHTIWDKVFKELNINYHGDFFDNNEDFRTEVITPPQGYEVQDVEPSITTLGTFSTDNVFHNSASRDIIFNVVEVFGFDSFFSHSYFTFGPDKKITVNQTGQYRISVNLSYLSREGYNTFQVMLNSGPAITQPLEPHDNNVSIDLNLSLEEGDTLQFRLRGTDTGYDGDPVAGGGEDITIENQYRVSFSGSANITFHEVTGGFLIDFSKMMGDLPQIDFIKDVMQRYGLVLKPVKGSNDYEFIQFENLLNDRENAEDWSDKLSEINGETYGIKYAKENKATYNYHEDIEVPTHDGILSIDNDNAEPEKELFASPYTIPTVDRTWRQNLMYRHHVWEEDEEDGVEVIKVIESPIKIFRINKQTFTNSYYFFNDINGTAYNGPTPFLSLNNIGMQYFIDNYYKAYRSVVNVYKEVDALFNLNTLDIYNLDLFRLKYLKQTGKYYYVNEIKHDSVSKVKLIEINEFDNNI